jgi:glutamate racemase
MNIGVFDSGFGGIDILRYIVEKMPGYTYSYLGDTARTPYGSRSHETVYQYTQQAIDFLIKNESKLIILACNTASAEALRKIQQEYLPKFYPEVRVLGVIIPTAEGAVEKTIRNRIGVIATEGTVASGAFPREIIKLNNKIHVFQQACPLLVPIIESGEKDKEILKVVLTNYVTPLLNKKIDTLILGCTHYGLIEQEINATIEALGSSIRIINEGSVVADKLKDYLEKHPEIEKALDTESAVQFYTTDLTDKFKELGSKFFQRKIIPKKIVLE